MPFTVIYWLIITSLSVSGDNREPSFLFQRISIIQFSATTPSCSTTASLATRSDHFMQLFALLLTLFLVLGIFTLVEGIKLKFKKINNNNNNNNMLICVLYRELALPTILAFKVKIQGQISLLLFDLHN